MTGTAAPIVVKCAHSTSDACALCAAPIAELETGHIRLIIAGLRMRIERKRALIESAARSAKGWGRGGAYRTHSSSTPSQMDRMSAEYEDKVSVHEYDLRLALEALRFLQESQS